MEEAALNLDSQKEVAKSMLIITASGRILYLMFAPPLMRCVFVQTDMTY